MSVEKVRAYLEPFGVADRMREFEVSSATVELAAAAVGVEPARIAKTLSFKIGEDPILIVAAGDAKIDNSKYKHFFGTKAKMLTPDEAIERIGHAVALLPHVDTDGHAAPVQRRERTDEPVGRVKDLRRVAKAERHAARAVGELRFHVIVQIAQLER